MRVRITALLLCVAPFSVLAQQTELKPDLTLMEVVQAGVERNLGILSQRLLRDRAALEQRAAWQAYSPEVVFDTSVARTRPGSDPFGPRALWNYAAGVSWRSPVGTVLSAEAVMVQPLSGGGDNAGGLVLSATQPLLKDGWLSGAALPLKESELQTRIQRESFRDALNALLVELETAYWDLAVAQADVVIKTRSRDRAQQQYEDTAENIRRGILADVEIYVVEENVVFFKQELLQAEENLRRARTHLAELLHLPEGAPLKATQELAKPDFGVPERDPLLAAAEQSNPRLQAQALRVTLSQVRHDHARNQALPTLDASASLSALGADPRYGSAWSKTFSDPTPEARVGVMFALPLDRGAVNASVDSAVSDVRRESNELERARQEVRFALVDGLTELDTNLKLLSLSDKQVELAELKLAAQVDKYKSGISTLADVVRFQRELDEALIRRQRVTRSVHVGRARLLASQGTLNETLGVAVK